MPFVDAQIGRRHGIGGPIVSHPEHVAFGVHKNGTESRRAFAVCLSLGRGVADKLGWAAGDKLMLAFGTGVDAGLIQFRKSDNPGVGYMLSTNGGAGRVSLYCKTPTSLFAEHYVLPNDTVPFGRVEFQAFGGRLLTKLPAWATAR